MKIVFEKKHNMLIPYTDKERNKLNRMRDGAIYSVDINNMDLRTAKQNRALHKWFSLVSESLNSRNLTITKVLKVEIEWTPEMIKEALWRPTQTAINYKRSSAELNKAEITDIYDTINSALFHRFGISIPFPSEE